MLVSEALRDKVEGELVEVVDLVVQRNGQGGEDKLVIDGLLVLHGCVLLGLGKVGDVVKSVSVEQVKVAFPENRRKMSKELNVEIFQLLISLLLADFAH